MPYFFTCWVMLSPHLGNLRNLLSYSFSYAPLMSSRFPGIFSTKPFSAWYSLRSFGWMRFNMPPVVLNSFSDILRLRTIYLFISSRSASYYDLRVITLGLLRTGVPVYWHISFWRRCAKADIMFWFNVGYYNLVAVEILEHLAIELSGGEIHLFKVWTAPSGCMERTFRMLANLHYTHTLFLSVLLTLICWLLFTAQRIISNLKVAKGSICWPTWTWTGQLDSDISRKSPGHWHWRIMITKLRENRRVELELNR
jgi:hypothetical protein